MIYPFLLRQIYKISREDTQNGGREHTLNYLCCGLESDGRGQNNTSGMKNVFCSCYLTEDILTKMHE